LHVVIFLKYLDFFFSVVYRFNYLGYTFGVSTIYSFRGAAINPWLVQFL